MADPVTDEPAERDADVATIVAFLAAMRRELGLSQWDVAIQMGSSQSHISEIETGETPHPRSDVLARQARTLGCQLTITVSRESTPAQTATVIKVAREVEDSLAVRIAASQA